VRHACLAAALCVACAVPAACGGDDSKKAAGGTATQPKASVPVKIVAPADGKRIRAKETKSGAWVATVKVAGTAAAGSTVYFRAGCKPKPCVERTSAGTDGTWSTSLRVRTQPSARFVPIDAGAQEIVASGATVATIELFGPRTPLADSGPSRPRENRARTRPSRVLPKAVLLIGDSLGVGMESALKAELDGWRVEVDARASRPLAAGMRVLKRQSKPPAILAFSLFTNDDPRNVAQLEAAVRATATRSGACAVWATIVRLPFAGSSYTGVNRRLKQLARQEQLALGLQIADWAGAVARQPSLLAGDRVHATSQGYRTLARLHADAIRACAGEDL